MGLRVVWEHWALGRHPAACSAVGQVAFLRALPAQILVGMNLEGRGPQRGKKGGILVALQTADMSKKRGVTTQLPIVALSEMIWPHL